MYKIYKVITGMLEENCYILSNEKKECVIIDPGDDFHKIKNLIDDQDFVPKAIAITHGHYDHTDAVSEVKKTYSVPLYMNRNDGFLTNNKFAVDFSSEEIKELEGFAIAAYHTPGHSPGGTCYLVQDNLFTGDTLFRGTIGRCDFDGGSFTDMLKSLGDVLMKFSDEIKIFPGHGPSSTIGNEKRTNPYMINLKKS